MTEPMKTVPDFEDMLALLEKREARYLIIGGLAFIFHAKPRFTRDIDLWIDSTPDNLELTNSALAEFGSPHLLDEGAKEQVVQVGLAPNRIDLLQSIDDMTFADEWDKRERAPYGNVTANWIDLDSLIEIKSAIDDPRHQADAKDLRKARDLKHD